MVNNIPFLSPDVEEAASEQINRQIDSNKLDAKPLRDSFTSDVVQALLTPFSPEYKSPDVFVAYPLSKNLDKYVRPNPVRKLPDAWLDRGWVWKYEQYKSVAGVPIRDRVIDIALMKKQPILCRVRGFRKYVFIIDPQFAKDFAEEVNSYEWISGSRFLILPIVKFKKVAYS